MQILIGNARYNCPCLRYVEAEGPGHLWLTVGLAVGFGVLLIVIAAAVVVACARRRCRREPRDGAANAFYNDGAGSTSSDFTQPPSDQRHCADLAAAAAADNTANQYCNVPTKKVDDFPYDFPAEKM